MLAPVTIRYDFAPKRRSLAGAEAADLFGLSECEPPHTVCENLTLDVRPGDLVLFVGPSGTGKSSIMRAVAAQLGALDALALPLPDAPLIDALPGTVEARMSALAACGLSEARLLMRTPDELSEGQRYRFRLCFGLTELGARSAERGTNTEDDSAVPRSEFRAPRFLMVDEFTAALDRTLARVVAFNVRKLVTRAGVGLLCATAHEDVIDDLQPDVLVRCHGDGFVSAERRGVLRRGVSFARDLWLSDGAVADWPHFARWHYRGHRLAFVTRVFVLWHGADPVGVVTFGTPAASLSARSRYFGLKGARSELALRALNQQLWVLQRVVLHPTYRGAGIASAFVRRACELCPVPWIETLTAMGRANPVFERAGFVRAGVIRRTGRAGQFGPRAGIAAETLRKSRFSDPVYYVRDNRAPKCDS
jgi:ABC-type ATPase with predicted acetyltransferase domain